MPSFFRPFLWRLYPARRWIIRGIAVGGGLALLGLVLSWPFLLRAWVEDQGGVRIGQDRSSFTQLRWENVSFASPAAQVEVAMIDVGWWAAWQDLFVYAKGRNRVRASGVLVILRPNDSGNDGESASPAEQLSRANDVFRLAERWLPAMEIENITVEHRLGSLRVDALAVQNGRIRLTGSALNTEALTGGALDQTLPLTVETLTLERVGLGIVVRLVDASLLTQVSGRWP